MSRKAIIEKTIPALLAKEQCKFHPKGFFIGQTEGANQRGTMQPNGISFATYHEYIHPCATNHNK